MKPLLVLLSAGMATAIFAANINVTVDNPRVERKSPQQIAQERREARMKEREMQRQQVNPQRPMHQGGVVNAYNNPQPMYEDRGGRYNERYGRYSQNQSYRGDYRRMDRRQRLNEVNRQIQEARQNLDRSRRDAQMYQDDLNFFNDKRVCYQRARDPKSLDFCDQNFR